MMRGAFDTFRETAGLMVRYPKAYVPKVFSTGLYSLYYIVAADITAGLMGLGEADINSLLIKSGLLLASLPLLYVMDVFTYAMYPRMVSDIVGEGRVSLKASFRSASGNMGSIVVYSFIIMASLFIATLFILGLQWGGQFFGGGLFRHTAYAVALVFAVAFSLILFFGVPESILGGKGIRGGLVDGARLGFNNAPYVLALYVFLLPPLLLSLWGVAALEAGGFPRMVAAFVFLGLRLFQAVAYTYACLMNQLAYLRLSINKA
jgi:hypothetical protein